MSTRGSPTDQISQSITAVIRRCSANRLPSRKSPCTIAGGRPGGALNRSAVAASRHPGASLASVVSSSQAPALDFLTQPGDRLQR